MRKKIFAILILAVAFAATLSLSLFSVSGCTPAVRSFTVLLGKTVYDVDEAFDFKSSKLYVAYADGSKRYVNLTETMLSDFDTAVSGEKTLTVTYRNKTNTAAYTVKGNVKTRLRLTADRGAGSECVISLKNVGFPVFALSFTMTGEETPKSPNLLKEGWSMALKELENGISVILYADNGLPIEENVVLFNFLCGADAEFEFSAITVASRDTEYEIPNAGLYREVETEAKT